MGPTSVFGDWTSEEEITDDCQPSRVWELNQNLYKTNKCS